VNTLAATRSARASRMDAGSIALLVLNVVTILAMAAMMWAALVYAQPASNLAGDEQTAQRIFYLHMGCNIGALVAYVASLIGSLGYLFTRKLGWDRLTQASVEIGTLCGTGTLVTGALWGKPTWNTYWTWDPRVTTATITVLIYIAFILFRNGIDNRQARARFSSIYALIAFLSVPITFYSARWFRTIHPVIFGGSNPEAQGSFDIANNPTMGQTMLIAVIAFTLLCLTLMLYRWRQLGLEDRLIELREELE
jgi:heme exporter protein C